MLKRNNKDTVYGVSVCPAPVRSEGDPTFTLENGKEYKMGTDPAGDIVLKDPSCDKQHCLLSVIKDEVWFSDNYTSYGSFLKTQAKRQVPLEIEAFVLGNTLFSIKRDGKADTVFTFLKTTENGTEDVKIDTKSTDHIFIGRDPSDTIPVLDDTSMSAHHAQLTFDSLEHKWLILDHGRLGNGSSNGVFIKVGPPTIIVDADDVVRVGKETFLIFKKI